MGTGLMIGLGVLVVLALVLIGLYNGLVQKSVATKNAWAQIDVQLKRRYDLIPNLVEVVKGYAKHEKETLEAVINARNRAAAAGSNVQEAAAAQNQLSGALRQLFALSEAYPDLKANTNFMALQEELSATENRIGFARQHYNDLVTNYNTSLMSFPTNLFGAVFGFHPADFFQLDPTEAAAARQAPKVQF
jgi:LemA protein